MSGFIFIIIVLAVVLLGRYAVVDTERIRNQKKFIKNMEDFDENKLKK